MATWVQISSIRILVNDPPGFVAALSVADHDALPATPAPQTLYYLADSGQYVATEKESDAVPSDYVRQRLRISDSTIGDLIDSLGAEAAQCRTLLLIATKLGADMQLKSTSMGGDVATFTTLTEMHRYYQKLADECDEQIASDDDNSTGRVGTMENPEIAGGVV